MSDAAFDPASFRDRRARVFRHNGTVFRTLDDEGFREWRAVAESPSFRRLTAAGQIGRTEEVVPSAGPRD